MKRSLTLLSLLAAAAAFAAAKLSVDQLLAKVDDNDKKVVTVTGKVSEFKARTSKIGNKYFTFKLKGDKGFVNVFGPFEFKTAPADGAKVEITGEFLKEKKLRDFSVKNQVELKAEKDLKVVK